MLAIVRSCSLLGIDGLPIDVEVDLRPGLPQFSIVGLPDNAVRESRDRVRAAVSNCGYSFPNKKITVNLAPAEVRKEGAGFDLPIAIAILAADELIAPERLRNLTIFGELALDGKVRMISGILPRIIAAGEAGFAKVYIPYENSEEARLAAERVEIVPVKELSELVEDILGINVLLPLEKAEALTSNYTYSCDFNEVAGQYGARRALEVAAAGFHNILMSGPPGSGKTMLARRLATILPEMAFDQILETSKIYSVSGYVREFLREPPFRSPHHTISDAGLIGGGNIPKPGEVSLAHNGVLFLDELPEFKKQVLEVLRQPVEDGVVTISRAALSLSFPSNFLLVAAMNPCPCGKYGSPAGDCHCHPGVIERYQQRISGPLLDRIDMHIEVPALEYKEMSGAIKGGESSADIRARVIAARAIQERRFQDYPNIKVNKNMGPSEIKKYCALDAACSAILEKSVRKLGLSARAYHRILKLARTIADLDGREHIELAHITEAIGYRRLSFG